ncbi:unnamed protein product [Periconia digitata]|uniref:Uncharacterized protein n=1 Tax=Periconia digitata TaxID=1303443 RepID=A0A9W4UKH0_9PLEO|nr:unnamed protein product [Periconia digitata]
MKLNTLFAFALAATVSAAPLHEPREQPHNQKNDQYEYRPVTKLDEGTLQVTDNDDPPKHTPHVYESKNWSGAVLKNQPEERYIYTSVRGRFTVPSVQYHGSHHKDESAAIWIGIDGFPDGTSMLQAGVSITVPEKGPVKYEIGVEWYPEPLQKLSYFPIHAGDVISIDIVANTSTTGTIIVDNESRGELARIPMQAPAKEPGENYWLMGQSVEWIVEDFQHPLANFSEVVFYNASAETSFYETVTLSEADVIILKPRQSESLSQVSIDSDSQLTVRYRG